MLLFPFLTFSVASAAVATYIAAFKPIRAEQYAAQSPGMELVRALVQLQHVSQCGQRRPHTVPQNASSGGSGR